jgi:glycosyltransferase involved in cell wall biosynthesis
MCTISLCMIVKNEEQTITNCLESVSSVVDEIIIVDTGSSDHTKKIARTYTDHVFDFKWINDFSAARNFAFSKASMDYILWLDADDVLLKADGEKIWRLKKELDDQVDTVTMIYHYAFDEFGNVTTSLRRNRLVKREKNYQWVGPVHEYLGVNGHTLNSDIVVTHTRKHAQTGRNLAIFENREKRGESFSPRDLYYFGNELMDNQRYDKALEVYKRFILDKKGWSEDVISACYRLSEIYMVREDYDKACLYAMHSFEYDLPRAELCCRLGSIFLAQKKYEIACYWFLLATKLDKPIGHLGFLQEACWTWFPHLQLCICYYYLGEFKKSYTHNEQALIYRPTDEHMLYNKKNFSKKRTWWR